MIIEIWACALFGEREKVCLQTACSLMSSKCACPFLLVRTVLWEMKQRINKVDLQHPIDLRIC